MTGSPALRDLLRCLLVMQRAGRPEVLDALLPDRETRPMGRPARCPEVTA